MRVVLADDEALLREGPTRLLAEAGFEVVGTAGNAAGLLRLIETRTPEVALTDIKMPPDYSEEGLVAAQEIRRRFPTLGSSCSRTISSPATPWRSFKSSPSTRAIC